MGVIKDYVRTALNGVTVYTKKLETKLRKEFDTKLNEFDTKLSDKVDVADIVPQVQADWNNVDEDSVAHILNRPFYDDIAHKTYTFENVLTSGQMSLTIGYIDGEFVEGESYVVTVNGTEYNFTASNETRISDGSRNILLAVSDGEFRLHAHTWWSSGATVSISGPIHILKKLDGKFIDGVTSLNGEIGDVTIDRDKLGAAPIDYHQHHFYDLKGQNGVYAWFDWIGDGTEHGTGLICGDTYIFNKYDGDTPILYIFNGETTVAGDYRVSDSILRGIGLPKEDNDAASKLYVDISIARADHIKPPTTATVGQILAVKSVDSTNKPTEWETVDIPAGGSGVTPCGAEKIVDYTVDADGANAKSFTFTVEEYPKLAEYNHLRGIYRKTTNGQLPWVEVALNTTVHSTEQRIGKVATGSYSMGGFDITCNSGFYMGGMTNTVNPSVYPGEKGCTFWPITSGRVTPLYLEELTMVTLGSYTTFLDEGGRIEIWGWND